MVPALTTILLLAGAAPAAPVHGASLTPLESAEPVSYSDSIRPILEAACYRCHSAGAETLEGRLRLDLRSGWESGGRSGAAVVPGHPERSLLMRAVRQEDPDLSMPPRGRLSDAEIDVLERWIAEGAHDGSAASTPEALSAPGAGRHWAFQPVSDPAPPEVRRREWVRNEIDAFVLARLEAGGLQPAPEADRRTLLRRLSFDLIGLPPTPAELADFLADTSPDAYEREVERLLASPHYGERWGRHWLDVARYADSLGSANNLAMVYAFEYRDWVVRALNQDVPYDRFLIMQLAGDVVADGRGAEPPEDRAALDAYIATAFLALGPKDLRGVDKPKLEMDMIDEQIDVVSRGLIGLSVACARCHDHKLDPISTEDYYALAGVFKSTSTLERLEARTQWREREIATRGEVAERQSWERSASELESSIYEASSLAAEQIRRGWRLELSRYLPAAEEALGVSRFFEAEDFVDGNLIIDAEKWGTPWTKVVRTGTGGPQYAEYEVEWPSRQALWLYARFAAVRSRPVRVLLNGELVREEGLAETTATWDLASQAWFEVARLELEPGVNRIRLESPEAFPHLDGFLLAPREPYGTAVPEGLVPAVVRNWARLLSGTRRLDSHLLAAWHRAAPAADVGAALVAASGSATGASRLLIDRLLRPAPPGTRAELAERYQAALLELAAAPGEGPEAEAREIVSGPESPFQLSLPAMERFLSDEQRQMLDAERTRLAELRAREPRLRRTLAVAEGEAQDVPVHIGGSHLRLAAEAVRRGPPRLFEDLVPRPEVAPGSSGRLELARWLTHPAHPLTARVIANRIWQGHFGHGLVRTASDFGLRGETPSHPELLDWLASRLVRDGWSLKKLHRRILLSSTYRMASTGSPDATAVDPENRLLWRQNRRRLEAEPLRDAILAVSGRLDLSMGGGSLLVENTMPVTREDSDVPISYDGTRRSLYLPVVRNAIYGFLASFDYRDASVTTATRPATTTVQQALALMNGPLVIESSEVLARRLLETGDGPQSDPERIGELYLRVLGRAPSAGEVKRAAAFLGRIAPMVRAGVRDRSPGAPDEGAVRLRAWRGLVQVLLSSNEFLNVD